MALKTFVKKRTRLSVLLKLDNTTVVAYINNQGGTVSKKLVSLTQDLWMWYLERNILIQAQHLPGVQNCTADRESRSMKNRSDWKLSPKNLFQDQQSLWATGSGPVCIQTDPSVPTLLQLAAISICRGLRCLLAGLDNWQGGSQIPLGTSFLEC